MGMGKNQQGAPELEAPPEARTGAGARSRVWTGYVPFQQFYTEHKP